MPELSVKRLGFFYSSYFLFWLHLAPLPPDFILPLCLRGPLPLLKLQPETLRQPANGCGWHISRLSFHKHMFVSGPKCLGLIKQELRHSQGFGRLRNIKIINTVAFILSAACAILLESLCRKVTALEKLIVFFFIASNLNPKTHWHSNHRRAQKLGWHGIQIFSMFSPVLLAFQLFFWIRVYYMPRRFTVWVDVRHALCGLCMIRAGLDAQMVDGTQEPIRQFAVMGSWHNEPEWPLLEMPTIELSVYLALLQVSHKIGIWGVFVVGWMMCCEVLAPPGTCDLPNWVGYFLIKQEQIFINSVLLKEWCICRFHQTQCLATITCEAVCVTQSVWLLNGRQKKAGCNDVTHLAHLCTLLTGKQKCLHNENWACMSKTSETLLTRADSKHVTL